MVFRAGDPEKKIHIHEGNEKRYLTEREYTVEVASNTIKLIEYEKRKKKTNIK